MKCYDEIKEEQQIEWEIVPDFYLVALQGADFNQDTQWKNKIDQYPDNDKLLRILSLVWKGILNWLMNSIEIEIQVVASPLNMKKIKFHQLDAGDPDY